MKTQVAIAQRVKFLIKHIVGRGIAKNQEELGKILGIENKSYLSQLVNCARPNGKFIESLVNLVPDFNKEWLYDDAIESPFIGATPEFCLIEKEKTPEDEIQELKHRIDLLEKDVKFYSEIADTRLQTIDLLSKLVAEMEKNR